MFTNTCNDANARVARGEISRAPEMQLEQGWQRPYGMAKTVYERENCGVTIECDCSVNE